MTGSLFTSLMIPTSPLAVRPHASTYSVDSFSEFSTRTVSRANGLPLFTASRSPCAPAREEDEELCRQLFAEDAHLVVDKELEQSSVEYTRRPTFIPQKPPTRRTRRIPNLRQRVALTKPASPLSTPCVHRMNSNNLKDAYVHGDDGDESPIEISQDLEVEKVTEEEVNCIDGDFNDDIDNETTLTQSHVSTRVGVESHNQERNDNQLEHKSLLLLDKLELKAVLHTPRPDLVNFYPIAIAASTSRGMTCLDLQAQIHPTVQQKNWYVKTQFQHENGSIKERNTKAALKGFCNDVKADDVATRLAHMENTYGTIPIVRKTRRETIDRLANPISGHSSTLQALSPRQRKKREAAAATSRISSSPVLTACNRRGNNVKAGKTIRTARGKMSTPTKTTLKRKAASRQDALAPNCSSNSCTSFHVDDQDHTCNVAAKQEKSKSALRTCLLVPRREMQRKKYQSQSDVLQCDKDGDIGGPAYWTQCVDVIEDDDSADKVASAPLQTRTREPSARSSCIRERGGRTVHTRACKDNVSNLKTQRQRVPADQIRSRLDRKALKFSQQPKCSQTWQTHQTTESGQEGSRSSREVAKVVPVILARAAKSLPSIATMLLTNPTSYFVSTSEKKMTTRASCQVSKKKLSKRIEVRTFDAPTKASEQRQRSSTSARLKREEEATISRHKVYVKSMRRQEQLRS